MLRDTTQQCMNTIFWLILPRVYIALCNDKISPQRLLLLLITSFITKDQHVED